MSHTTGVDRGPSAGCFAAARHEVSQLDDGACSAHANSWSDFTAGAATDGGKRKRKKDKKGKKEKKEKQGKREKKAKKPAETAVEETVSRSSVLLSTEKADRQQDTGATKVFASSAATADATAARQRPCTHAAASSGGVVVATGVAG